MEHRPFYGVLPIAATLIGLLFMSTLSATDSPESIPGSTRISAERLIGLVEESLTVTVIDARIPGDRKQGFIEGSLSLPDVDTTCDSLAQHLATKATPSLFYCNGIKCGRSAIAVKIAVKCGYTNIYWFRGGFEEWLAKGYPYMQE